MARFLADENFPLPVVQHLRLLGHDVMTMPETGQAGQGVPDDAVLQMATKDERAVLTLNRRDFVRLHRMDSYHGGVVACSVDHDFSRLAERIHASVAPVSNVQGQLIRVYRPDK